mmetsp:Transcript_43238/g.97512  ORF Transcript_43238/g.97512 Transcript_43238/m.97512 type:complete len:414 (+) Transcript_43238:232-1473(+)
MVSPKISADASSMKSSGALRSKPPVRPATKQAKQAPVLADQTTDGVGAWLRQLQGSWIEVCSVHAATSYSVSGPNCIRYRSWAKPLCFRNAFTVDDLRGCIYWGHHKTYVLDMKQSNSNRVVWTWNSAGTAPKWASKLFQWERVTDSHDTEAVDVASWTHLRQAADIAFASSDQRESLNILWREDDLAVVSKPAGLSVVAGGQTDAARSLTDPISFIRRLWETHLRGWLPVHRLDTNTTGTLLLARTEQAGKLMVEQFAQRTVCKEYMCIVHGALDREGVVNEPILTSFENGSSVSRVCDEGKPALTRYTSVRIYRLGGGSSKVEAASLVRVHIQTGRTHQIRCHMQHLGHPLCGDVKYGGCRTCLGTRFPRMLLHAFRLGFSLSADKFVMATDLIPEDFLAALASLSKQEGS